MFVVSVILKKILDVEVYMKVETFCFFLKKNFGGTIDLNDDYFIFYYKTGSYTFAYTHNRILYQGFDHVFDLSDNATEETIVDYFIYLLDNKIREILKL